MTVWSKVVAFLKDEPLVLPPQSWPEEWTAQKRANATRRYVTVTPASLRDAFAIIFSKKAQQAARQRAVQKPSLPHQDPLSRMIRREFARLAAVQQRFLLLSDWQRECLSDEEMGQRIGCDETFARALRVEHLKNERARWADLKAATKGENHVSTI